MTTFRSDSFGSKRIYRIDLSSRLALGVILLGLAVIFGIGIFSGEVVLGLAGATTWTVIFLHYATLVVKIDLETVSVNRFGRTVWKAPVGSVSVQRTMGGDLKTHPCLRLSSPKLERDFDMLESLFGCAALDEVEALIGKK